MCPLHVLRWRPQLSQPHYATHGYQTVINSVHATTHTIHMTLPLYKKNLTPMGE